MRCPSTTFAVRQLIPMTGSDTRKEARSGMIKTAWVSSFTQNWHCRETDSTPVTGINIVGATSTIVVGNSVSVKTGLAGRTVSCRAGGVWAGKLQDELSTINSTALIQSLRQQNFISYSPQIPHV